MSIPKRGPSPASVPRSVAAGFKATPAQPMLGVRIDAEVHKRFRLATVAAGLSMAVVVEELIIDWLREHESTR